MKLLTKKQEKLFENSKICSNGREKLKNEYLKDKKYCKVRDHCHYAEAYRGVAHRRNYKKRILYIKIY